jgi:hypothetical protein
VGETGIVVGVELEGDVAGDEVGAEDPVGGADDLPLEGAEGPEPQAASSTPRRSSVPVPSARRFGRLLFTIHPLPGKVMRV